MERIRTLFAVIVSAVLTLGFVGCAYLTLQGKGPAYYQGIVTPATTMLFLFLTLGIIVLAALPDKKTEIDQDPPADHESIPVGAAPVGSGPMGSGPAQFRAVVELPVEEE